MSAAPGVLGAAVLSTRRVMVAATAAGCVMVVATAAGPVMVAAAAVAGHLTGRVMAAATEHQGRDEQSEARGGQEAEDLRPQPGRGEPHLGQLARHQQQQARDARKFEQHRDPVLEADRLHVAAGQERQPDGPRHHPHLHRTEHQAERPDQLELGEVSTQQQPYAEPALEDGHHQEARLHHRQVRVVGSGRDVDQPGGHRGDPGRLRDKPASSIPRGGVRLRGVVAECGQVGVPPLGTCRRKNPAD